MHPTLSARDKKVVWHPYTPQKYNPEPIAIEKGEGLYLFDINGKKYIDAISSWWVTIHGHAHPYIAQKLYEQALKLEQVIFAGFTHEPAVQLAEKLLTILPGRFSKIFYSDNGSTAVEVAIKMAVQYWWNRKEFSRTRILALRNSYHGDTVGAMSVSERSVFTLAFEGLLFDVSFIDPGSEETAEHDLTDLNLNEFACFIYEPLLQGAGGMKMYPPAVLQKLLKKCREAGIVCIADEVLTGFGRTGKLFASAYVEESPDIICLSKGLTGGTLPLGVTACNEKIYEAYLDEDPKKTFFHGHSFTANPLSCATALASLELLKKAGCLEAIEMISSSHSRFLEQLSQSNLAKNILNKRSLGTIAAFEFNAGNNEYLNSIGKVISGKALEKGLFIRPLGNTVYLMPPYCISQQELQEVYQILTELLGEIKKAAD